MQSPKSAGLQTNPLVVVSPPKAVCMPAESSTAGQARRSRLNGAEAQPPEADICDRRNEQAETSASSPRLDPLAAAQRSGGPPIKSQTPGKAATVRVNARTSARAGTSPQQPLKNGDHAPGSQRPKARRKADCSGLWSRSAGAAKRQVASAPLVSWPGAAVLLLAIGLGTWLPSQSGVLSCEPSYCQLFLT